MSQNHIIRTETFQNPSDTNTRVQTFVMTPLETNCYAVINAGEALVIDPASAGSEIASALTEYKITMIVATHGHGDHVSGVLSLMEALPYKVPFAVGAYDRERVVSAVSKSNLGLPYDDDPPAPSVLLHAGDTVVAGEATFEVLHTPGHTKGGIVLYGEHMAFTGDTLFKGSAGRTDFAGGDAQELKASLAHLKKRLSPETVVFPGHGPATTFKEELASNPFLQ